LRLDDYKRHYQSRALQLPLPASTLHELASHVEVVARISPVPLHALVIDQLLSSVNLNVSVQGNNSVRSS
jgi:hypothetical protein